MDDPKEFSIDIDGYLVEGYLIKSSEVKITTPEKKIFSLSLREYPCGSLYGDVEIDQAALENIESVLSSYIAKQLGPINYQLAMLSFPDTGEEIERVCSMLGIDSPNWKKGRN